MFETSRVGPLKSVARTSFSIPDLESITYYTTNILWFANFMFWLCALAYFSAPMDLRGVDLVGIYTTQPYRLYIVQNFHVAGNHPSQIFPTDLIRGLDIMAFLKRCEKRTRAMRLAMVHERT